MGPSATAVFDREVARYDAWFGTSPGLHEWPERLEEQLVRQLAKAREDSNRVIVVYGSKCLLDVANPTRDTDELLARLA